MSEIASQMWCLARCLPFFIGEFIPENDQNWDNYLRLLTIMDHVFAPTTTSDKADYLEMLIEDIRYYDPFAFLDKKVKIL